MKAIRFPNYGPPEKLQLQDVEKPTPNENQVLVKIHACAANPLDWHRMRGAPFLARLSEGLLKPRDPRLGADIAGTVEAVGNNVTEFKVGDAVFGDITAGGFAEYVAAAEKHLVHKPANLSFEQAAAVPVAALTALQGLRDTGKIQAGQSVLVNGASGGVGSFAVQIAKAYGARVIGVCSTRNLELVRSIGADQVIDYSKEDFTKNGQQYDILYDLAANHSLAEYERALTAQGKLVMAGFSTVPHLFQIMLLGKLRSKEGGKQLGTMGTATANKADMLVLKGMLESGKIVPVIDRHYPLAQTAEAIRYLETARARGKVIVTMA